MIITKIVCAVKLFVQYKKKYFQNVFKNIFFFSKVDFDRRKGKVDFDRREGKEAIYAGEQCPLTPPISAKISSEDD